MHFNHSPSPSKPLSHTRDILYNPKRRVCRRFTPLRYFLLLSFANFIFSPAPSYFSGPPPPSPIQQYITRYIPYKKTWIIFIIILRFLPVFHPGHPPPLCPYGQ